jgi:lactate dehydrogenase-like 2-hydroxyacid dehydrogenase
MSKPALLSTGPMMPLIADQLEAAFEVHWMHKVGDVSALVQSVGPRIEAVCTGSHTGVKTDAALLARLPALKVIGNFGVGYDTIDVPTAVGRGIVITNTPDVLNEEVADTALGLLLMTVRELSKAEAYMRAGRWAKEGDYRLTPGSLRDRKIGIMGFGRIGRAIARRLEAFNMPISYFARRKQPDVGYPHYSDLVAMARDVDILLAILPGGPATQNIINAEVLAALGPRGIFINMARGSIVDETALIAALKNKTILAAGLDVFLNEPNINPEFLTLENATIVPHVGSASVFTRDQMGQLVVDNLMAYRERKPPKTPVPETPFKKW